MEPDGQEIFIHIWDYDDASEDETLGRFVTCISIPKQFLLVKKKFIGSSFVKNS